MTAGMVTDPIAILTITDASEGPVPLPIVAFPFKVEIVSAALGAVIRPDGDDLVVDLVAYDPAEDEQSVLAAGITLEDGQAVSPYEAITDDDDGPVIVPAGHAIGATIVNLPGSGGDPAVLMVRYRQEL